MIKEKLTKFSMRLKYESPFRYKPFLRNIKEIKTIKVGDTEIKIVSDISIPPNEIHICDEDGNIKGKIVDIGD